MQFYMQVQVLHNVDMQAGRYRLTLWYEIQYADGIGTEAYKQVLLSVNNNIEQVLLTENRL